jgi:hypothetical protein
LVASAVVATDAVASNRAALLATAADSATTTDATTTTAAAAAAERVACIGALLDRAAAPLGRVPERKPPRQLVRGNGNWFAGHGRRTGARIARRWRLALVDDEERI